MLLARKNAIRALPKKQYSMLLAMCRRANSLANVAEWHIRHYGERTGKYLSYGKNYKISKYNPNYKMLQAQVAQQTLKRQDKKHQAFFSLLRAKKAGTYSGEVNPPHDRKKSGYDNLYISGEYVIYRGDCMAVPMSAAFLRTSVLAQASASLSRKSRKYRKRQRSTVTSFRHGRTRAQ